MCRPCVPARFTCQHRYNTCVLYLSHRLLEVAVLVALLLLNGPDKLEGMSLCFLFLALVV